MVLYPVVMPTIADRIFNNKSIIKKKNSDKSKVDYCKKVKKQLAWWLSNTVCQPTQPGLSTVVNTKSSK